MAECCYDWRKYWEDKDDGGSRINWVARLPDGHLILSGEAMPGMYWMCFPDGKTKHGLAKHSLVPKRTLRAWTAEEAVKFLGKTIYNECDEPCVIDAIDASSLRIFPAQYGPGLGKWMDYKALIVHGYKTAERSPCGVFEEVK